MLSFGSIGNFLQKVPNTEKQALSLGLIPGSFAHVCALLLGLTPTGFHGTEVGYDQRIAEPDAERGRRGCQRGSRHLRVANRVSQRVKRNVAWLATRNW